LLQGIIDYRRKGAPSSAAPRAAGAAAAVDVPLKDAIRTLNFWLYVFCLFVSFGGGNYVNANIAQIVQASGGRPAAIPFLITIMSLASCLSRVMVGATAQLLEEAGWPRTLFVLGSVSCMLASQLCLATATSTGLYIGAALGQARKRHFLSHLYIKCIILPRQARDKHRENSKKVPFSLSLATARVTPFTQRSSLISMGWRTWPHSTRWQVGLTHGKKRLPCFRFLLLRIA